jgi:hypothetical protein
MDQAMSGAGDVVHGLIEHGFVQARRPGRTAELAHELQRRGPNLLVARRGLEVRERLDVATHARPSCLFENHSFDVIIEPDKTAGK